MSTVIYRPGDTIPKDPSDEVVIGWDWDTENLAVGATIVTSAWAVAAYRPASATPPTLDAASILVGSRSTQVRVAGGSAGSTSILTNTITTNETPTQKKERSVYIQVR